MRSADRKTVLTESGPDLPRGKQEERTGVLLDPLLERKELLGQHIDATSGRVVEHDSTTSYPAELSHQSGPGNAVWEKSKTHDCVEGSVTVGEGSVIPHI